MSLEQNAVIFAAQETQINARNVLAVLNLLITEQSTVPFVARYRKEATGGMDEVQIRNIHEAYENYLEREKRREYILDAIKKMEQMTPELEKKIRAAETINQLEDLYAPYKAKKKSKGMLAKEAGLEPLANIILGTPKTKEQLKAEFGDQFNKPDLKIKSFEDAYSGAFDIIIETMAHDTEVKDTLRADFWKDAVLKSTKRDKAEEEDKEWMKYKDYFEFSQKISELKEPKAGHRFLAMRRGMTSKTLKVDVVFPEEVALGLLKKKFFGAGNLGCLADLELASKKAYMNYIYPSLDLEVKSELKRISDETAINVFGVNLKNLLLQPYLGPKAVIGVDPGVRTGCKIAIVDNTGKFLADCVIYPHEPHMKVKESATILNAIIEQFKVHHIAIGNGTYGRETLAFIQENVKEVKEGKVNATMISEAGASVYSASEIAAEEFPDKDVTVRGAISIARRFQDPLAELVKIDPKSIGVGQYQHDVNQARLKKSLEGVVESCVNFVGVDINTASAPLLAYVSGIGPGLAGNVVKYRDSHGAFKNRKEILKVTRFSPKVYEQAAGFLRIYNGEEPLDATFIHPERYDLLAEWAKKNNVNTKELVSDKELIAKLERDSSLKAELGELTFNDIVKALKAPSQDPRTEFKSFEYRKDVSKITDLKIGEWYPGLVTNITQFGAFVDIGIKENGLLHVSQISDNFVEDAMTALKVGQEVKVQVMDIDYDRGRISLTAKQGAQVNRSAQAAPGERPRRDGPSKRDMEKAQAPSPALKNNAFAGLKNLKL
ncbi:RNA-binding transcriptional accessory protein [Bacteriovorax stolpii]|uniref:Tex family protein n=1 Tax=Bacteriovorax stolpii TaxID=960 RepID=UPI001157AEE8|nr:Tex family protein [Bacteriovorax stolpii]QDK41663.1 RNA-binding transcriptional accessory protein [Bacteriovorax stolpii]